jgi:hypothetical protein
MLLQYLREYRDGAQSTHVACSMYFSDSGTESPWGGRRVTIMSHLDTLSMTFGDTRVILPSMSTVEMYSSPTWPALWTGPTHPLQVLTCRIVPHATSPVLTRSPDRLHRARYSQDDLPAS